MGRKSDLQADLTAAGIPFVERDTIAELEDILAEVPAVEAGSTAAKEARRQARRDEEALAALNRANDVAAAKAKVRTAAQQALDRGKDSA